MARLFKDIGYGERWDYETKADYPWDYEEYIREDVLDNPEEEDFGVEDTLKINGYDIRITRMIDGHPTFEQVQELIVEVEATVEVIRQALLARQ